MDPSTTVSVWYIWKRVRKLLPLLAPLMKTYFDEILSTFRINTQVSREKASISNLHTGKQKFKIKHKTQRFNIGGVTYWSFTHAEVHGMGLHFQFQSRIEMPKLFSLHITFQATITELCLYFVCLLFQSLKFAHR